MIDVDTLRAVAPRFTGARAARQAEILDALEPVLGDELARWQISTPLRVAHFVAQIAHESAGFRTTEEFASGAAYEGRADLGNTEPGDGRRFKGRGLIQLTGRANYARAGGDLDLPLEAEPELAAEPALSLTIAGLYWRWRNINAPADRDDLIEVTRRVNGGRNGLADRRRALGRAKAAIAQRQAAPLAVDPAGAQPVIARGARGAAVADLQRALRLLGLAVAVDEIFGPATELAVRVWQRRAGLEADGIVGRYTWAALEGAIGGRALDEPI